MLDIANIEQRIIGKRTKSTQSITNREREFGIEVQDDVNNSVREVNVRVNNSSR